jgi:hypothetical protein
MLAEPIREPDAASYVLGVLRTDHGIRVQRVAVAVQTCNLNTRALELSEEVVSRCVGGQDVVECGDVYGWQETARVELNAGEAELGDHLDRLRK